MKNSGEFTIYFKMLEEHKRIKEFKIPSKLLKMLMNLRKVHNQTNNEATVN